MEAAGGGIDVRTRQMLAENRANSANLRDLLRIKQEDNNNRSNVSNNNNLVGLTLGAVLNGDMRSMSMPVQPNRTLFDIIRDEPVGKNSKDGKKSWKLLKKKLNLRRAGSGSAWTSSTPIPASDVGLYQNNSNRFMTRRHSTGLMSNPGGSTQLPEAEASSSSSVVTRSSSDVMLQMNMSQAADRRTAEEEGQGESSEVAAEGGEEQPVRMSLMSLLEETDRQMGLDGSGLLMGDSEEDENEDMDVDVDVDVDIDGGRERGYNSCCVCMVRHKGAAFIPCGHTFCRLCSRELWVQRGNCPLCNNFIKEILDIF